MFESLKRQLYFPLAWYFKFFAAIRLRRWNPRIIVVTGSNGKTTLLHMLESQLGKKAKFSHHANSSYGIPFDILDLHRKTLHRLEWISLFLTAPFQIVKKVPKEKLYVVEADTDRPGEGRFLASLLKPEVVLWTNASKTHTMYFDNVVAQKNFSSVEEAIAYEYGYFIDYCTKLAIINGELSHVIAQKNRTSAETISIIKKDFLKNYSVTKEGTDFTFIDKNYHFSFLLPEDVFLSIQMCRELMSYLDLPFDQKFREFSLPPGRGSVFNGIKNTILIDSSYNANFGSIKAILEMFEKIASKKKWVVLGDMLELGKEEQEEHEKLGEAIAKMNFERIILVGERVRKFTAPKIAKQKLFVGNQKEV